MTKSCIFVPIATDRFMFKLTYQKEQNKTKIKKKGFKNFLHLRYYHKNKLIQL